jgi:hypothetical protein
VRQSRKCDRALSETDPGTDPQPHEASLELPWLVEANLRDCNFNGVTPEVEETPVTDVTDGRGQEPAELSAADEQLLQELTERARAGGLKLTGEGGLLGRLTKMVVEGALEGEMDDHLGYGKHDPAGRNGSNSRNGHRPKTVLTEAGPVDITVPRDRDSSFEPKIVAKRQRRLTGVEDMVISLSAKGLTHGEIAAHLAEVYGAEVSKQTITTISDRVMDGMAEWQSRPLDTLRSGCGLLRSRRGHRHRQPQLRSAADGLTDYDRHRGSARARPVCHRRKRRHPGGRPSPGSPRPSLVRTATGTDPRSRLIVGVCERVTCCVAQKVWRRILPLCHGGR